MWLDNLKELKKSSGMTLKQIAEASRTPESTVKRIFAGDNEPYASTLQRIVTALGGSLDDILADTNAVISPQRIEEVKEQAIVIEAERDLISVENDMLKTKVAALTSEIELLKRELMHKDELLALHKYYNGLLSAEQR